MAEVDSGVTIFGQGAHRRSRVTTGLLEKHPYLPRSTRPKYITMQTDEGPKTKGPLRVPVRPRPRSVILPEYPNHLLSQYLDSENTPPQAAAGKHSVLQLLDSDDEANLRTTGKLMPSPSGDDFIIFQADTQKKSEDTDGPSRESPSQPKQYPYALGSIACFEHLGFSRKRAALLAKKFFSQFYFGFCNEWEFQDVAIDVLDCCDVCDVEEPGQDTTPLFDALGLNEEMRKSLDQDMYDNLFEDGMTIMDWVEDTISSRCEAKLVADQTSQPAAVKPTTVDAKRDTEDGPEAKSVRTSPKRKAPVLLHNTLPMRPRNGDHACSDTKKRRLHTNGKMLSPPEEPREETPKKNGEHADAREQTIVLHGAEVLE
ncbi:hypothetical protein JX266_005973 [Neoarthrinium moseri]|nr:hypothetical protein JX266_005973 [Neoarthrinium moseri]